jgi:excinuclease ABC subunit C
MTLAEWNKLIMPDGPGVYLWKQGSSVLYVGKATSLRDRVRSYFSDDLIQTRGPRIIDMVTKADSIEWRETDSVLEALIFEANLIKEYTPFYNVKEKDDRSFNYVVITDEAFPRVVVMRGRVLDIEIGKGLKVKNIFGPFTNGGALREAIRIMRRMFPFLDATVLARDAREFYKQIGLTPETATESARTEYLENIRHIRLFFEGKKGEVIRLLTERMHEHAQALEFERAHEIKKRIFALEHIRDVSLVKEDIQSLGVQVDEKVDSVRIEAYDTAHISGTEGVSVMVVLSGGEPLKSQYRKFKLDASIGNNDIESLRSVLMRRFSHDEWRLPKIIVIDGGETQRNVAMDIVREYAPRVLVVSVVKDKKHKPKGIVGDSGVVAEFKKDILLANAEAHRFALAYHRKRRYMSVSVLRKKVQKKKLSKDK